MSDPSQLDSSPSDGEDVVHRRQELVVFLFVTVMMAPILSVVFVGGYGLLVWLMQILTGPPGV